MIIHEGVNYKNNSIFKLQPFVVLDLHTLIDKIILVIKFGHIKIFFKCVTNALSNSTNYHFLMKVPRMKPLLNICTTCQQPQCDLWQTEIHGKNPYKFSQITQIYHTKDSTRLFHDSQTIPSISPNKLFKRRTPQY